MRVVDAHHDACGASTRVRLPGTLSARAVRRFHCAGCAAAFEAAHVEEIEMRMADAVVAEQPSVVPVPDSGTQPTLEPQPEPVEAVQPLAMEDRAVEALTRPPRPKRTKPNLSLPTLSLPNVSLPTLSLPKVSLPKLPSISLPKVDPDSRSWKLLSIPIAAVLVIVILLALNGGKDQPAPVLPAPAAKTDEGTAAPATKSDGSKKSGSNGSKGANKNKFVHESSFSLALPEGWQRIDPPAGATFAAVAADGGADATLWITQDPKLDFPTFIQQSLAQMKTLTPDARVTNRVAAPTAEGTIVTLGADAPADQPAYSATLRVAGDYRYYLATTVQPDAGPEAADGVDLITGSLTPELEE